MSCAKQILIIDTYVGLFLDIQSRMVKVFRVVVTVSVIAVFDSEYFFNLHEDTTYQYKYKRKKITRLSFFAFTYSVRIYFVQQEWFNKNDRCWPNF